MGCWSSGEALRAKQDLDRRGTIPNVKPSARIFRSANRVLLWLTNCLQIQLRPPPNFEVSRPQTESSQLEHELRSSAASTLCWGWFVTSVAYSKDAVRGLYVFLCANTRLFDIGG